MPSNTPLTDAINALTTYSNTVTGASDTTLSDAVATLAAGYGGGGGIELVDLATQYEWEIGAVNGATGNTYPANKTANVARLRPKYLIATQCLPYRFSMNWGGGEWVAQYAQYGDDGKSKVNFSVITADTDLPTTHPYIVVVLRHSNGTTAMNVSDVDIMKPKLTLIE